MARRQTRSRLARKLRVRRRRAARGAVALLVAWHHWLPSWGTSVLVHAVLLLVLAVLYLGSGARRSTDGTFDSTLGAGPDRPDPLGESVTTIVPADRAGDPWTKGGEEFPSFSFAASKPDVATSTRPAQPSAVKFAPNIAVPRINLPRGTRLSDTVQGLVHVEDMTAPFSGRDPDTKAKLVRREGGSVASEQAVARGLEWLARHQRADGAWTLDCHEQCPLDPPCPIDSIRPAVSDTAATGLGLLPMLGAGYIHTKPSRYSDNIKRGLEYLAANQSGEGEIYLGGGVNYRFYSHAIAAMALCEAYGLSKDPKLQVPAQRAINFIVKTQNLDDGGWRYFPGQPGDTSVIGWQIFALRSGKLAGLVVPNRTIAGCRSYLDLAAVDPKKTLYAYLPGRPELMTMTAEALLCRQYLGWTSDNVSLRRGAGTVYLDLTMSNSRNIYYWYYATQLLHNLGGKEWVSWNKHVRDGLVGMQVTSGGCDVGSWSPIHPQPDVWGQRVGRHYVTALSLLTLEVYYRWLPLYRPAGVAVDPKDAKAAQDRAQADRPEPAAKAKRP
jgi:hypothetical protein